jgi:hypothetical protein
VQAEFDEQGLDSERAKFLLPFKVFAGNKPTNTILIEKLTQVTWVFNCNVRTQDLCARSDLEYI